MNVQVRANKPCEVALSVSHICDSSATFCDCMSDAPASALSPAASGVGRCNQQGHIIYEIFSTHMNRDAVQIYHYSNRIRKVSICSICSGFIRTLTFSLHLEKDDQSVSQVCCRRLSNTKSSYHLGGRAVVRLTATEFITAAHHYDANVFCCHCTMRGIFLSALASLLQLLYTVVASNQLAADYRGCLKAIPPQSLVSRLFHF